jgi:hypothetical protein
MLMDHRRFTKWLKNIFDTREHEISCSECFDQLSRFVELETSGEDAASRMPEVRHHLNQCRACRDEYETLRDLRRLEENGDLPSLDDLKRSIE